MSRAPSLADHVAAIRRQVDSLPSSEKKARLQIRLTRAATALARRISAEAKAKR
jgi:hypothetical protein